MTPLSRSIILAVLTSAIVGCNGDGSRANEPTSAGERGADAALGANRAPNSGASSTPVGAKSAEQIASQVERDIAEYQRMTAGRRPVASTDEPADSGAMTANGAMTPPLAASAPVTTGQPGASSAVGAGGTPGHVGSATARGVGAGAPSNESAGGHATNGTAALAAPSTGDSEDGASDDPTKPRRILNTPDALSGAAAALYRDATRADTPMRSLMALAALSIAEPDRPFNAEAMPDLTEEERRTLGRFHGFCRDLGLQLATSDDPAAVARAVEQLASEIRGERRLRVPRADLCTRVDGFGAFAPIEPREFVAHSGARFVLYFEVDGYRSANLSGEGWKTELSVELSILSERDGVPVWRRDWETITDLAATQRRDFFVTHVVSVPSALSVGGYVLKVRVRDELTSALAEYAVPFVMVASTGTTSSPGAAGAASESASIPPPARSIPAR